MKNRNNPIILGVFDGITIISIGGLSVLLPETGTAVPYVDQPPMIDPPVS
jgi:hypothetical protein